MKEGKVLIDADEYAFLKIEVSKIELLHELISESIDKGYSNAVKEQKEFYLESASVDCKTLCWLFQWETFENRMWNLKKKLEEGEKNNGE